MGRFVGEANFRWRDRFADLTPGNEEFTLKWKALAVESPEPFFKAQHEFIKRTHYDPLAQKTAEEDGLDVTRRSNALQNVVWSTAVQHGPHTPVISRAMKCVVPTRGTDDPEFDRGLIRAIYGERGRRGSDGALVYFQRNSRTVQASVARRFADEERDALRMLAEEGKPRIEEV